MEEVLSFLRTTPSLLLWRAPKNTTRAEIIAYMIYLEGPGYPEYVTHTSPKVFWDPQTWEYVRQFSPRWSCPTNTRKSPKILGVAHNEGICYLMHFFCIKYSRNASDNNFQRHGKKKERKPKLFLSGYLGYVPPNPSKTSLLVGYPGIMQGCPRVKSLRKNNCVQFLSLNMENTATKNNKIPLPGPTPQNRERYIERSPMLWPKGKISKLLYSRRTPKQRKHCRRDKFLWGPLFLLRMGNYLLITSLSKTLGQQDSGFSKHAFREVPFRFRRGTVSGATLVLPDAPRMPKNKSKEASVPGTSPKAMFVSQVDRTRDNPFPPENALKSVLGTRLEGTFECKARLENAAKSV